MKTTFFSACPLNCFDGCSIVVKRQDEQNFNLSGNAAHPITRGHLCGKGYALKNRHDHPDRLLYPLKKVGGSFQRIRWEKALQEIAAHLARAYQEKGPTSVFYSYDYASSGLLTLLEARLFNRLGGMSETVSTLCWSAGIAAQKADMGESRSSAPETLKWAKHIIVWGRNVTTTNMHLLPFIQEAVDQGARLAVVDPYPQKLVSKSDLYVPVRPGGDYAAILYIMKKLIHHGRIDVDFIRHHTKGFEALRQAVLASDEDALLTEAGVSRAKLDTLYTYVAQGPTRIIAGYGLQRYKNGGLTIRLLDALMAMTGQIGRRGGGIDYAHTVLGKTIHTEAITRSDFRHAYRPIIRAMQADILPTLNDPALEVLYVTRANPLAQAPGRLRLKQAYEQIPVKIVVEQFMTETAAIADYVLPAATVFEQSDLYYSSMWHGYIQYAEQIVPPRGEARAEWEIITDLAKLLGVGEDFQYTPEAYWRMALGDIMQEEDFKQLFQNGYFLLTPEKTAWETRTFLTDDGTFHFVTALPEAIILPKEKRSSSVLRLITIHPRKSLHSQHRQLFGSDPAVRMSPELAERLGLRPGDQVRLSNDGGVFEGRVVVQDGMRDDMLVIEEGVSDGVHFVNDLTPTALSDLGDGSTQYETFVHLEKIVRDEQIKDRHELTQLEA